MPTPEVNPIIQGSNDILSGPIILIVLLMIPIFYGSFFSKYKHIADEHNEKEKDNPKFVPVTDNEIKGWSATWTTLIIVLLLAYAIWMVIIQSKS